MKTLISNFKFQIDSLAVIASRDVSRGVAISFIPWMRSFAKFTLERSEGLRMTRCVNLQYARSAQNGAILIVSLWILALLALMASSLSFYSMLQMKIVRHHMSQLQGRYLAQAGVFWAMRVLAHEDQENFQALNQTWAASPEAFQDRPWGDGHFRVFYETEDLELGAQTHFGIMDEERKININTASREILERLPEANEELVDAILDWRDANSSPERRGAEKDYYQDLKFPYPAKDGPLEALEELLLVRGMKEDILKKWAGLVTVYGDGRVNVNTASTQVLKIAGLDEALVEKIMEFRRGPDGLAGTEDDPAFKDEGAIARTLFDATGLDSQEVSQIVNGVSKGFLGVKSKFFTLQSAGTVSGSSAQERKVIAVVEHVQGDEVQIKSWQEK